MATYWKPPHEPWELLRLTAASLAGWFRCQISFTITMRDGNTMTETIDRREAP
jgi:hypothetical protein